jgi:hypothetical protein
MTSSGKSSLIKTTPGGIMYILSSNSTTPQDLQFYTSSSQQSLTLNAAGNVVINNSCTLSGASSKLCLAGGSSQLGIGTSSPQNQLEVNNTSGTNCAIKAYCGSGDCSLILQSATNGRSQFKTGSSDALTIYANYATSTIWGMNIYLSSSVIGMQWTTSGDTQIPLGLRLANPPTMYYSTVPTINNAQVGYTLTGTLNSTASLTTTLATYQSLVLVNVGVDLITGILATGLSGSPAGVGVYLYQGSSQLPGGFSYGITSAVANNSQQVTCTVNSTSASQTYSLQCNCTAAATTSINCSGKTAP